jgi:hypothetical protein
VILKKLYYLGQIKLRPERGNQVYLATRYLEPRKMEKLLKNNRKKQKD